jgi:hypothetical protein
MVTYTIKKFNAQTGNYEPVHTCTITEDQAKEIESFFAGCLNAEQFYYHQLQFPNGTNAYKYSTFRDVLGMLEANNRKK